MVTACQTVGNWTSANRLGATEPTVTPMLGMKVKRKKMTAQNSTWSRPTAIITIVAEAVSMMPVIVCTQI
jgi:hypothetical protein